MRLLFRLLSGLKKKYNKAYTLKHVHLENAKVCVCFVLFSLRIQMSLSCPQEPTKLEADLSWPFLPLEDVV